VGDFKYGSVEDPLGRLGLHAFRLAFRHPVTGEPLKFETPFPQAFTFLMNKR
jgi:23S rRNA pseudouridine1911/1915/1917 synthase